MNFKSIKEQQCPGFDDFFTMRGWVFILRDILKNKVILCSEACFFVLNSVNNDWSKSFYRRENGFCFDYFVTYIF